MVLLSGYKFSGPFHWLLIYMLSLEIQLSRACVAQWTTHATCKPIINMAWVRARLCNLQKGCTRPRPQVIKFTSCLPMVGGYLRVLRLLPPINWSPWYSWNIAECGVKTPTINQSIQLSRGVMIPWTGFTPQYFWNHSCISLRIQLNTVRAV